MSVSGSSVSTDTFKDDDPEFLFSRTDSETGVTVKADTQEDALTAVRYLQVLMQAVENPRVAVERMIPISKIETLQELEGDERIEEAVRMVEESLVASGVVRGRIQFLMA